MGIVAGWALNFCGSKENKVVVEPNKEGGGGEELGSLKLKPKKSIVIYYKNTRLPNQTYICDKDSDISTSVIYEWFKTLKPVRHMVVSIDEKDGVKHNFDYCKQENWDGTSFEIEDKLENDKIINTVKTFCSSYFVDKGSNDCIKNIMILFLSKHDKLLSDDENIKQHGIKTFVANHLSGSKFEYVFIHPSIAIMLKSTPTKPIAAQATFDINTTSKK